MADAPGIKIQPAYVIPLSTDHLLVLGMIAVIWGQIDFCLDKIIAHAYGLKPAQRKALIGDAKPIGAKISLLRAAVEDLPQDVRKDAKELLRLLDAHKQDRNAAFHGIWGFMWSNDKPGELQRASLYPPTPTRFLKPDSLPKLAGELGKAAQIADKIACKISGIKRNDQPANFYFPDHESRGTPPPEWLHGADAPWRKGRPFHDRTPPESRSPPKEPDQ